MKNIVVPAALCATIALAGAAFGYHSAHVSMPLVISAPLITGLVVLAVAWLVQKST